MFYVKIPESKRYYDYEIDRIKDVPGVYCIYGGHGNKLLYIGKSKYLNRRVEEHFKQKASGNKELANYRLTEVVVFYTKSDLYASILELYLITIWNPALNIQIPSNTDMEKDPESSLWKCEPGWFFGYTEDIKVIERLRRYYFNKNKGFKIMTYYTRTGENFPYAIQFKFPSKYKRTVEKMMGVEAS